ncbi:MAG: hypothetical protein A2Z91_00055 [Deltaproteobacteria bacterium GWA2_38_16]|nr:MAG: hypothetical protein A2Z91_00055 [Deltaproteobacteria bacterium GWA2_38_16]OGQ03499.1 MAG: hypothetical protein A3D19_01460 [Deltaproteobacteria bacterium RIFCSPHIGHO2_02_FULL_38_15]OGQ30379.1 MAG: hypothetical protein A3A72_01680 [Deltaproteobacteria bacterium RIFCSPLOWO2_01_FULL_38_9]OGQ58830.1 MAG: hypothetical protein A3G92_00785 [Deltaproteobacteria bacterium RIFCSPLOWO2_12_FULL_38_8]HBQ21266.1 hypothetical protein [Deltaproteobacteria bacterium]
MSLYFVTGNKNKFKEFRLELPKLKHLYKDLPEIQDLNEKKVLKAKLLEAFKYHQGQFIVEDTSVYLDCLYGLPGPFAKWFMTAIDHEKLFHIVKTLGNNKAQVKTLIGYAKNKHEFHFFEGSMTGQIVFPKGKKGFGWDPIFKPDGFLKTYAQMTRAEKMSMSMRRKALNKLKTFLEKHGS